MPEALDINDELPFSPGAGWLEMKALLDSNLPVKKSIITPAIKRCMIAAMMLVMAVFSSLHLGGDLSTFHPGANRSTVFPGSLIAAGSIATSSNQHSIPAQKNNDTTPGKTDRVLLIANEDNRFENAVETGTFSISRLTEQEIIQHRFNDSAENRKVASIISNTSLNNQRYFSMTTTLKDRAPQAGTWEVAAGIGMNVAAGKQQHLQPYPVAEVKYNLNKRFYVAAGLAVFSPAPATVAGVTKTLYVNDTANNIRLYSDLVNYDHLSYVDLPLSVGINISRKISFQTGLQASFLLSRSSKKAQQAYGFQVSNAGFPVEPPVAIMANAEQNFNVQLRKVDYRFLTGIKYKQGSMTAGLTYQYGLQSPGMGATTSKNRNQFVTVSLLYQIK